MGHPVKYLFGQQIGECVYLGDLYKKNGRRIALFKCKCGQDFEADISNVKNGNTNSCGCHQKQMVSNAKTTHGLSNTKCYDTWARIINRCENEQSRDYELYGGRGISVADEWRHNPVAFIDYMKELPHAWEAGYSIDRIENDDNYRPGNVRWATAKEQALNRRMRADNKTGFEGICKLKSGEFQSRIMIENDPVHLGTFKNIDDAVMARNKYIFSNGLTGYKIQ